MLATDSYLSRELPAIRRARDRTRRAIDFTLMAISGQRWRHYSAESSPLRYLYNVSEILATGKSGIAPPAERPTEMNLSTPAMCLAATAAIAESGGVARRFPDVTKEAAELRAAFADELAGVCERLAKTRSGTYGDNDALTASWLAPLLAANSRLGSLARENLASALSRLVKGEQILLGHEKNRNTEENHSWVVLSVVSAAHDCDLLKPDQLKYASRWAIGEVHQQLSFGKTEARFDPAHLICAVALALMFRQVALPLLEAAIDLMCQSQRPDGTWVIERSFIADEKGRVNRPIAPELGLGACQVVARLEEKFNESARGRALQFRLLEALQRQREAFFVAAVVAETKPPVGQPGSAWQSEYANLGAGQFHIWANARVVESLVRLWDQETRLVTVRLLDESGFSKQRADLSGQLKGFERLTDPQLDADSSVLKELQDQMAVAREQFKSVVLYGPPGTSKTSLAAAVAKQLDWWLISLSPADFLIGGPDTIEYQAKRIFAYLVEMEQVVILFDEIDRLLLDRSSEDYQKQTEVFKFMTPSMLPKLAALWSTPGVRIVIATNYGETLDPAVTRPRRIDKALLVPPPNRKARLKILDEKYAEHIAADVRGKVADASVLWTHGELTGLGSAPTYDQVKAHRPDLTLRDYDGRLDGAWRQKSLLVREVLTLGMLIKEVRELSSGEVGTLRKAWEEADDLIKNQFDRLSTDLAVPEPTAQGGGQP